jgi:flagellar biosynthetic protein FliO
MDGAVLKSFAILIVSVGIVFFVLTLIKKYSNRFINQPNKVPLKILAKLPLNQKSFICIVEAEGKTLLLGVTEKSINTLAQLNDELDFNTFGIKKKSKNEENIENVENKSNNDLSFMNFLKSSIGIRQRKN